MTSDEQPTVSAAMDPLDDLVLAVRGDQSADASDYELPPAVTLDQASEILGLTPAAGRELVEAERYPVPVIAMGPQTHRVGTAHLIRHAGLSRVREVLRVQG
ncbi:hypothetical protein [Streptomyces radicis]|uniref:Uncharacterized protein n=1 Tax=Streptomyces radicis TaxID=1750517 RepID=A0A3A9W8N6_9ACTN|nr:hypothetical protein [Streptomyces radicis]RKN09651.1 hypothetical protein D7319_11355 [Streptomyces radicis]